MNDFTKDELEIIQEGLCYAVGASIETGGMMVSLLLPVSKKIQTLIDNYHEPHAHKFYPSITGKNWECDCGAFEDDFTEDERGVL